MNYESQILSNIKVWLNGENINTEVSMDRNKMYFTYKHEKELYSLEKILADNEVKNTLTKDGVLSVSISDISHTWED